MSSIYLNSVRRLLQKNGTTSYSLKKITPSGVSSSSPSSSPTVTTETISLLSFVGKQKEIDGSTIKKDDIKFYIDPTGLIAVPTTEDKIIDGSSEYFIKDVDKWLQGDTVVLYILQLRK